MAIINAILVKKIVDNINIIKHIETIKHISKNTLIETEQKKEKTDKPIRDEIIIYIIVLLNLIIYYLYYENIRLIFLYISHSCHSVVSHFRCDFIHIFNARHILV
jgi:hypothetical protein